MRNRGSGRAKGVSTMPNDRVAMLYLEPWQLRMVKDFSSLRIAPTALRISLKGGCAASYKIPAKGMRKGDWLLYLTNPQSLQLKEQLGLRTAITTVNINKENITSGAIAFQ
jgi:hypothetical protein